MDDVRRKEMIKIREEQPQDIKTIREVHNAIEVALEGFEPDRLSSNVSKIVGNALESGANSSHRIQF